MSKSHKARMYQLLHDADENVSLSGSMKWEDFVKIMRSMVFEDTSMSSGSSVRFNPPSAIHQKPIAFHKR
ncbi:hypothetical protein BDQ17DRAFT_1419293 [Cyathus striatus]|nr:hypothetical protein BDQ17DRAFT_1419293 [Cyathus striatus]